MDIEVVLRDSFAYAQEALVGKWTRWAIFVILALPFSLIQFTFDPKTIITGTNINWDAIPLDQIKIPSFLGIICSFLILGYMVCIYRGVKPAPDFTAWRDLFIDGIKLAIVWFLWFLPIIFVLAVGIAIAVSAFLPSQANAAPNWILLVYFVLQLLLVELFPLIIVILFFGILGVIRFARTGSIREGIRISAIVATIRTIGWLSYVFALVISAVIAIIYGIITSVLSFISYIGWVLVLIIAPFFSIFFARYFTLVYDQGMPQAEPPVVAG